MDTKKIKIAVYAIAKNEEQFVESWYNSAKDADYLLIADTGSEDETIKKAKSLGINVFSITITPWRFEDARNASMALIPKDIDYCIALDMDEVLVEGWRDQLEEVDHSTITRPRYKYTWNWNEDGSPGLQYNGDKIHSRHGYRWKYPVHEVMVNDRIEEVQGWCALEIHHHADMSKPRSQYLPLLKQSVVEDPSSDRNAFYYGRELYFYGRYEEASKELQRHLSLPTATWAPERAASMRYISKCDYGNAEYWLLKAIEECPGRREALVDLSEYYYSKNEWEKSIEFADKALDIKEKPLEYLCESDAWGYKPHDLKAIAYYNLGNFLKAHEEGLKAFKLNEMPRLSDNLKFYKSALDTK